MFWWLIRLAVVHGMALAIAVGPWLPGGFRDVGRAAADSLELSNSGTPGPGPLLHKPGEQLSVLAANPIAKLIGSPTPLRSDVFFSPHSMVLTPAQALTSLQSAGVRLQI